MEFGTMEGQDRSIEQMADDPTAVEPVPEPVPDDDYVEGTTGQLSLSVGGRAPDTSRLVVRAIQVDVEGQYAKGETVELRVVARIDEVKFTDTHDDMGTVTATKRVHSAKPLSAERIGAAHE